MENRDLQSVFGEDYQNLVVIIQELINEVCDRCFFTIFRKEYMCYKVLMDMFSNCLQRRKYRSRLGLKSWETRI